MSDGVVFILRGVSGSGKSTFARERERYWEAGSCDAVVVSADDAFTGPDGAYTFDPAGLGEAHADCLRRFMAALARSVEGVIVDNTNTTAVEMAPYYAVAKAYGYHVTIVTVLCNVAEAAARNTHGVPEKSVVGQYDRMTSSEGAVPAFWDVSRLTVGSCAECHGRREVENHFWWYSGYNRPTTKECRCVRLTGVGNV
jgi:predicted kinase